MTAAGWCSDEELRYQELYKMNQETKCISKQSNDVELKGIWEELVEND